MFYCGKVTGEYALWQVHYRIAIFRGLSPPCNRRVSTTGLLGHFGSFKPDSMLSGYLQPVITRYVFLLWKHMYTFYVDGVIGDVTRFKLGRIFEQL